MSTSPTHRTILAIQAEALRDAADEIERELVCCDAFEKRDPKHPHKICYWGGAAATLVRDRAAELEQESA